MRFQYVLILAAVTGIGSFFSSAYAAAPPRYNSVHVHVFRPKVGIFKNSIIQMGSKEGQAIIKGTCAIFGQDCTTPAAALGVAAESLRDRGGNERHGRLNAPQGYV